MDWWTQNKDAITAFGTAIGTILAIGGIIWAAIKWGFLRGWQRKLRVDVKVFEVITDPAVLLPKLFATENDNSPLADHRITYQPRDSNRDIQAELKAALNRSRYLLITAPTGYGKTREAGMLAQTMMLEGWRILRIKTGWLDVPKTLPEELNDNRSRILVLLDDLNGLFSTGERTQSPRAEKIPLLNEASYHDRLLQVLDMFEGMCTENEIRVVATARSEADQWELLDYVEKDKLWKRFERVELPEPTDRAIVDLIEDSAKQVDLKGNPEEFKAIAHKSDGTYRNILLNLRRWKTQNQEVSRENFTETLNGSWQDIYKQAVKKYPAVEYIYDAIDVLRQAGIELIPFLVEPTAAKIWGGNWFQGFLRRGKIRNALRFLTKDARIIRTADNALSTSDGQIEARKKSMSWMLFAQFLTQLLLEKKVRISIFKLAWAFDKQGKTEKSQELMSQLTKMNPTDRVAYSTLGFFLRNLKRNGEAEAAYRKAIALGSSNSDDYFFWGTLLEDLDQTIEAETAYRKAIEIDPDDKYAYFMLGHLLQGLNRFTEAEAMYRDGVRIDPLDPNVYKALGGILKRSKRHDEAESVFRKAIELDPSDSGAYKNLARLLDELNRYEEAETAYRKSIEINSTDYYTYFFFATMLAELMRTDEAESVCRKSIEIDPTNAFAQNLLGTIMYRLSRVEESESAYRKAIELKPSFATAYSNLGTLLKDLKRYEEAEAAYQKAIQLKPSDATFYNNLGLLLHENLERFDEAETFYRKAIDLNPTAASAFYNLGILLQNNPKSYDEVETLLTNALAIDPQDKDILYRMACIKTARHETNSAIGYLGKAIDKGYDPKWAWEDPDLAWIRDDPHFVEIVGPKPEK